MQIGLVFGWWVCVDDHTYVVDVDTAGCNVGGNQRLGLVGCEHLEVALTRILAEVAVHLNSRNPSSDELFGELFGAVLGAGKHHCFTWCCCQVEQHWKAIGSRGLQHMVLHFNDW